MAAHKAVQPVQGVLQPLVVPAGGNQFHQIGKAAVVVLIVLLDGLDCDVLLEQVDLVLAAQAKIRRYIQKLKVCTHQLQTEGMDGADVRRRQQGALPQQVAVGRIFCQQLGQAGVDSLAHLLGCRIGKGDHQNPVGIHRMFAVGEDVDHPLHQHCRFAAARCRRNQHRTSSTGDCLLLGAGPFWAICHLPSPPS